MQASHDSPLLLQISLTPDALGPRSVFLGLGASLHGQRAPSGPPFLASVPMLARALRLEHISVLKLDCEGCECAGLPGRQGGLCHSLPAETGACHKHQQRCTAAWVTSLCEALAWLPCLPTRSATGAVMRTAVWTLVRSMKESLCMLRYHTHARGKQAASDADGAGSPGPCLFGNTVHPQHAIPQLCILLQASDL